MTRTIEVEIDDSGTVRPMDPTATLPRGRAQLVWQLETMLDPVSRAIAKAPIDDDPESEGERRAVAESKAWLAAHPGQTISHAEMMAEFESMRRSQPSPRPSRMVIADNGLAFFPANGRVLTPEMVKATQEDTCHETVLLSEASLAADWLKPEENEAWAYMQPDR